MTEVTTLAVPVDLADALKDIAAKSEIPIKWTDLARNTLWGHVAMHRARGNV